MKKVLIVEDDPMLSEIYQKKFEKSGKFEVIQASSGVEAKEKAKQEKPDLILLDLVLPEMDGFDVLKKLRQDPSLNSTKIIPFSNLSQEDNKKKLEGLGADGFISKAEHTPQQLIVEVEKLLKEDERKASPKKVVDLSSKKEKFFSKDQKRILIIEDEEVFLEVFGNKLEEAGYKVEKTLNGKEGYDLLTRHNFSLVLVDVVLPDMEAKRIITEFKTKFPKSRTKFIVLSSESDLEKNINELKKIGIQEVIDKDKINPEQFVEEIKETLG